eukprot:596922-Hanusia_phi.AAC.3
MVDSSRFSFTPAAGRVAVPSHCGDHDGPALYQLVDQPQQAQRLLVVPLNRGVQLRTLLLHALRQARLQARVDELDVLLADPEEGILVQRAGANELQHVAAASDLVALVADGVHGCLELREHDLAPGELRDSVVDEDGKDEEGYAQRINQRKRQSPNKLLSPALQRTRHREVSSKIVAVKSEIHAVEGLQDDGGDGGIDDEKKEEGPEGRFHEHESSDGLVHAQDKQSRNDEERDENERIPCHEVQLLHPRERGEQAVGYRKKVQVQGEEADAIHRAFDQLRPCYIEVVHECL